MEGEPIEGGTRGRDGGGAGDPPERGDHPRDPVTGTMAERLGVLLDRPVRRAVRADSRHDWEITYAELDDGTRLFVKALPRRAPASGVFTAEARGLSWLGQAFGTPALRPLAWDERIVVLPWVTEDEPTPEAAERLGRNLAAMHLTGAAQYGAPWEGYIGPLPMDNTPAREWPAFFAEQRLRPYLRRALDRGALTSADARTIERVIDSVPDLAGPTEPPARIHGDLWNGNVLWGGSGAVLIDPAAHGGHRESDLAMLSLFGLPHLDRVRDAYNETAPLAEGWRGRVALHQLHPLLVHACLFGAAYRTTALDTARTALRGG